MKKSFLFVLIAILTILSSSTFGQSFSSIQINSGMIFPFSASNGFSGTIGYKYYFNKSFGMYAYTGYFAWGKNFIIYKEDMTLNQHQQYFDSYSTDNNMLIPLYVGCELNLYKSNLFSVEGILEAGYSRLSYDSYQNIKVTNPSTEAVTAYKVDPNSGTQVNKNLFGAGIGIGISHPLSKYLNLALTYKFNILGNSKYTNLLSSGEKYTSLLIGLVYNL